MATAAMPDVKYEVPHTVDHEDGTARKQTQERQAQGTGCNSWWSTPCHLTPELGEHSVILTSHR